MGLRVKIIIIINKNEFVGEIPIKVKTLATLFAGISKGKIAKILSNCFRLINLYKYYLMKSQDNLYQNQIYIDESIFKM